MLDQRDDGDQADEQHSDPQDGELVVRVSGLLEEPAAAGDEQSHQQRDAAYDAADVAGIVKFAMRNT